MRTRVVWVLQVLMLGVVGGVTAQASTEAQLDALLDNMAADVLAGDQVAYLAQVDLSDPLFALEHTRWSDEWAADDFLASFALQLENVRVENTDAIGDLTMTWRIKDQPRAQAATFSAQFTRDDSGEWRYAGEYWPIVIETDHFILRAVPETENAANALLPALPDIYAHVTASLDHEPSTHNEIKLYGSADALAATTLLSLPRIHGWNEPGESLKMFPEGDSLDVSIVAHEFTHFLVFDMAGTQRSRMPWWLDEGLAQYVASTFWTAAYAEDYLAITQGLAARDALAAWDSMRVFEETPVELWQYVYPQGYAFARFITETYGEAPRNAWLRAMSTEMEIEAATEAVFGVSFDDLDAAFRAWLAEQ